MMVALIVPAAQAVAQSPMDKARATYAALTTYADAGTVVVESKVAGAPMQVERFTIRTQFRRPRQFLLEFASTAADGDRLAIWCEGEGHDFESWWKTTGVHDVHTNGTGLNAFLAAAAPTQGASLHAISVLLPQTALKASLADFAPARTARDSIGGRAMLRLSGMSEGHFGSPRPRTVWVDPTTGLIWRIVDDTPAEYPVGSVERVTVSLTPVANPAISAPFRYRIPGAPR